MSRDDLFEGLESPAPPPGLREAALRGRAGRPRPPQPLPTAGRVLLNNRGLRVAWLTAVLLLAFAHARVPREGRAVVTAAARRARADRGRAALPSAENSPRAVAGFALEGGPL